MSIKYHFINNTSNFKDTNFSVVDNIILVDMNYLLDLILFSENIQNQIIHPPLLALIPFFNNIDNVQSITFDFSNLDNKHDSVFSYKKVCSFIELLPESIEITIIESVCKNNQLGNLLSPTYLSNILKRTSNGQNITTIFPADTSLLTIPLTIMGSCDSRDIVRVHDAKDNNVRFSIKSYIANNSLAALSSSKLEYEAETIKLPSTFLSECVKNDLDKSTLLKSINSLSNDSILLLDFMDERFDINIYQNTRVTNSWNFRSTLLNKTLKSSNMLAFDSDTKFNLSCAAIDLIIELACDKIKKSHIIINKVYMSTFLHDGNILVKFDKEKYQIDRYNAFIDKLYNYIDEKHPEVSFIDTPVYFNYCDHKHIWGSHPYHYNNAFYLSRAKQIKLIYKN